MSELKAENDKKIAARIEKFQAERDELDDLFNNGIIDSETHRKMSQDIYEAYQFDMVYLQKP